MEEDGPPAGLLMSMDGMCGVIVHAQLSSDRGKTVGLSLPHTVELSEPRSEERSCIQIVAFLRTPHRDTIQ